MNVALEIPRPEAHPDIERILFSEEEIRTRVSEVAAEISRDYAGRKVTLIAVLRGSVFFLTDLARALTVPARIDFLAISPFTPRTQPGHQPGMVRIIKDLEESIEDEDVLLVEDVVDTGLTLRYLLGTLNSRLPRSLAACAFLDKTPRRLVDVPLGYRCFEIPDRFVVGYGLDYHQLYRNLPYVGVVKSEVFRG